MLSNAFNNFKMHHKIGIKSQPRMKLEGDKDFPDDDDVLMKMFISIDKSEDGILSREDLWNFVKSINRPMMQEMTRETFEEEVYSRCEDENRGVLFQKFTLDDFKAFMEECALKEFLLEADVNGDGIVTFDEVLTACLKKGLKNINYSDIAAIKMLFDAETDTLLDPREITEKLRRTSGKALLFTTFVFYTLCPVKKICSTFQFRNVNINT